MWAMGFFGKSAKTQILKSEIQKNKTKRKNALRIYKTLDRSGEKKTDRRIVYLYNILFCVSNFDSISSLTVFSFVSSVWRNCAFFFCFFRELFIIIEDARIRRRVHTPVSPLCSLSSLSLSYHINGGISNFPSRKNLEKSRKIKIKLKMSKDFVE